MATDTTISSIPYFRQYVKAAPLAVFRFLFGMVMLVSMIRFWSKGWIEKLYLAPKFHFHYSGFEFVQVPGNFIYLLFFICGAAALFVALGYKYRQSIVAFLFSFIYIELLDKTTYLNHYYFVSVVSFVLMWLPAHAAYSVDASQNDKLRSEFVPRWTVDVLMALLAIVYLHAGLAKLNYDWMIKAMPLSLWLPSHDQLPIIGGLMREQWLAYLFSWGGAAYDLTIVLFLLWKRTRIWAFAAVVLFHVLTRILFPIGMFPYIMICGTLVFFGAGFHETLMTRGLALIAQDSSRFRNGKNYSSSFLDRVGKPLVLGFLCFQIFFPLRSLLIPGNVFWTERGYRYSWKVMLMEKTAYANFKIVSGETGQRFYVQNDDFLTPLQRKEMSTQPDFILEYGQYLGKHFSSQGHGQVEVYVESRAALNGRRNQVFIDPGVDLMKVSYKELCSAHIVPLNE